jgi:hypothetical protein
MTRHETDTSLDRTAVLAGFMFLASLLVPLLNFLLVFSKFIAGDDAVAKGHNVVAHPFLFRVNVVNELVTSVVAVVLGLALYAMLESVHRQLALVALSLKLIEATLWAVIALAHVAALLALGGRVSSTALQPEQVQALVGLFLDAHMPVTAIPGVFLGLSSVVFLYLLFRSRYVPRALAAFGVFSYALVFAYDLTLLVAPSYAAMIAVQVVGWGPSVLFELAIGPWLLIKGITTQQRVRPAPASP